MAARSWSRRSAIAFGAAGLTGIAQLGVALGLGILPWRAVVSDGDDASWRTALAWLFFIVATSVVCGSAAGHRRLRTASYGDPVSAAVLLSSMAAAIAVIPFALAQVRLAGAGSKIILAGGDVVVVQAGLLRVGISGVVAGAILAYLTVRVRPIAVSVAATIGWVWVLALATASVAIADGVSPPPMWIGTVQIAALTARTGWWLTPVLSIGMAGLLGLVTGALCRWRRVPVLGVALSGLAAPCALVAAYVVAGFAVDADPVSTFDPFVSAVLAAIAGLLASTMAAVARRPARPAVLIPLPAPGLRPALPAATPAAHPPAMAVAALAPPAEPPIRSEAALEAPRLNTPRVDAPATAAPMAGVPHPVARNLAVPPPRSAAAARSTSVGKASRQPERPAPSQAPAAPAPQKKASPPKTPPQKAPTQRTPTKKTPPPPEPTPEAPPTPSPPTDGKRERLSKHEREHVAWIKDLVNLPNNPELNLRRRP